MLSPEEHKTVQSLILKYAQEISWNLVSHEQDKQRRSFADNVSTQETCQSVSRLFDNVLYQQVQTSKPHCTESSGTLIAQLSCSVPQNIKISKDANDR